MPHELHRPRTGWGITTGLAGHQQQVLGVLEELVAEPRMIEVSPAGLAKWLAPWVRPGPHPLVTSPWPDIIVTAGRQSAPYARAISRKSHGRTFCAVLQDPKAPPSWFDFLWVNEHDATRGANVMRTLTAPHRVTPHKLNQGRAALEQEIAPLPAPYVGLILGGPNSVYAFSPAEAREIAKKTSALAAARGASILVTPSRRTGDERIEAVAGALEGTPHWIWDGVTENPYFGILGLCDEIVATCDSVNMLGEVAVTGKPLHMARLRGKGGKFDQFHKRLVAEGAAKWLDEQHDPWSYTPIDSRQAIVTEILRRYDLKMQQFNTPIR